MLHLFYSDDHIPYLTFSVTTSEIQAFSFMRYPIALYSCMVASSELSWLAEIIHLSYSDHHTTYNFGIEWRNVSYLEQCHLSGLRGSGMKINRGVEDSQICLPASGSLERRYNPFQVFYRLTPSLIPKTIQYSYLIKLSEVPMSNFAIANLI